MSSAAMNRPLRMFRKKKLRQEKNSWKEMGINFYWNKQVILLYTISFYLLISMSDYLVPRLATVHQNTQHMAERGVDVLLHGIERRGPPFHEVVPFQLTAGESVARLPLSARDASAS